MTLDDPAGAPPRPRPRAAGACLAAAVLVALAGCATPPAGTASAPPAASSTAPAPPDGNTTTGRPPTTARVSPVDWQHPRTLPARPEPGVDYPYDLYAHCGIEWTWFAGATWRARIPLAEPRTRVGADGITRYSGYVPGTMRLLDPDTAEFTADDRHIEPTLPPIVFERTAAQAPGCD
ncbi:hypothetical protein [Catellatospora vulcania]|uniref:hypothetical protein n=1 Tax=Catellatospora vulcania TaxID=1460450 RepID=UPI0012D3A0B2|nr:hypothetical protein [Catellatospora vulcania]